MPQAAVERLEYMTIRRASRAVLTALTAAGLSLLPRAVAAQQPVSLAPNAPEDKPISADDCQWKALLEAERPLTERARTTLPAATARFKAGLPSGQTFFVTVRLSDTTGHREQVFVAIDSVDESTLIGRIWSPVELVRGYHEYERYTVRADDIVDWMISKPDGSEEGNEVGKLIDTYRPPAKCLDSSRSR